MANSKYLNSNYKRMSKSNVIKRKIETKPSRGRSYQNNVYFVKIKLKVHKKTVIAYSKSLTDL